MHSLLTGADLFALLLMLRAGTADTLIVVEGASDSKTLNAHLDHACARTVVGYGKPSVVEAIKLVEVRGVPGVIGLVDSDLESFSFVKSGAPQSLLVRTENYDLEADILFINGMGERVIYAHVDKSKIDRHQRTIESGPPSPYDQIIRLAMHIGELRLRSMQDGLSLYLRELPLGMFLGSDGVSLDTVRLGTAIRQKSKHATMTSEQIAELIDECIKSNNADRRTCCGHDMLNLLAGALAKWWGVKVSYETLSSVVRAALSEADLKTMWIYHEITRLAEMSGVRVWRYDSNGSANA